MSVLQTPEQHCRLALQRASSAKHEPDAGSRTTHSGAIVPCKNCGRQTSPEQHEFALLQESIGSLTHARSSGIASVVVTAGGNVGSSAVALPPQAQQASVASMPSVAKAEKGVSVEGQPVPMPPLDVHQRLMKYRIQESPCESCQPGWFWQGSAVPAMDDSVVRTVGRAVVTSAAEQNEAKSSQQSWRRTQSSSQRQRPLRP